MASFHVIKWTMGALNVVRGEVWDAARDEHAELKKVIEGKR